MGDLIDLLGQIIVGAFVAFLYIGAAITVIAFVYHCAKGFWDLLVDLIGSFFGKSQSKTGENKPSPVEYPTPFTGKKEEQFKDGVYYGDYVKGLRTGKGVYRFKNGDVYEGGFKTGLATGKGIYKFKSGDVYEGDWVDGIMIGKGIFKWKDGNIYDGDWVDDIMTGKGIFKWKNGDVYEGDFVDGKRTGKGAFSYKNGNTCGGEWDDGMMTGKGWFRWANGNTYTGDFLLDYIDGRGAFRWSSGEVYSGDFEENILVEFGKTLDIESGNFDNGWKYSPRASEQISEAVTVEKEVLKEALFEINRVYRKTDIYKILNVPKGQRGGKWRNGYCEHNKDFFIFANIGIPGKTDVGVFDYKNKVSGDKMEWEAQNGSKLSWPTVQKLISSNPYIFVRYKDFRSGSYKFIGVGECLETRDTTPVYFKWRICGYQKATVKPLKKPPKTESVLKQHQERIEKYGSDEVVEKPKEKKTGTIKKKTLGVKKISKKKEQLLDSQALRKIFNSFVKNNFNIYGGAESPFKIRYIHDETSKEFYWIFLKNISPAYFDNPDVSRIQVGNKPVFKEIQKERGLCIPVGYDSENKVFVVWSPDLFLERVVKNKNISIYSRFSEQSGLDGNFKEFLLKNDESVYVVKPSFISVFLKNIKTYFEVRVLTKQLPNKNSPSPLNEVLSFEDQEIVNGFLRAGKSGQLQALKTIADKNPNLKLMEAKDLLERQKSFLNLT